MKISGREFLRTLSDYFSQAQYESEIFLLLILPGIVLTIALLFYNSKSSSEKDPFASIPPKDFELLDSIRMQKGLEEFDRDFLINIAFNFSVKPTHLLLDKDCYERVEMSMIEKLRKSGENPAANKSLNYLKTLKKRLFS